uniref:ribosomal protein L12 n=1 Tax=Haramonas pauciplastida TaxID=478668 RepID=UPI002113C5F9|nr:ribosomal protein L12 [Haramonas pauciplastida]UTE94921.1 ribosomal protein L12 [Haramonas pauciplastida]
MSKASEIIVLLETLNLSEASELVKKIEATFDVDTSIGGGMMMVAGDNNTSGTTTEEKTEFNLSLDSVPAEKKIGILKIVRTITGLGLKEAKELVDNPPVVIQKGIDKAIAEANKVDLEKAGAVVSLK